MDGFMWLAFILKSNNALPLGEVANFVTDYFPLKIKFIMKVNLNFLQISQSC